MIACPCDGDRCDLTADDPRHGTVNGYNNRLCRCRRCRDAWAAAVARRQRNPKNRERHNRYGRNRTRRNGGIGLQYGPGRSHMPSIAEVKAANGFVTQMDLANAKGTTHQAVSIWLIRNGIEPTWSTRSGRYKLYERSVLDCYVRAF